MLWPTMETLALSRRPVPSTLRPSIPTGYPAAPTSLSLLNPQFSRARTVKCSAISPPSFGKFLIPNFSMMINEWINELCDWYSTFCAVDHSAKFNEAAKHGNLIPLYRSIFSDHLTPVLAYRCLVKEDDRDAPSFLFESVEPGLKVSSVVSLFW